MSIRKDCKWDIFSMATVYLAFCFPDISPEKKTLVISHLSPLEFLIMSQTVMPQSSIKNLLKRKNPERKCIKQMILFVSFFFLELWMNMKMYYERNHSYKTKITNEVSLISQFFLPVVDQHIFFDRRWYWPLIDFSPYTLYHTI